MKKSFVCTCIALCVFTLFSFTNKKDFIGTWSLSKIENSIDDEGKKVFESGPVYIRWDMKADNTSKNAPTLAAIIPGLGSMIMQQIVKDITIQEDGHIIATYSDGGYNLESSTTPTTWQKSAKEDITYKAENNQIRVFFNVDKFIALLPDFGNNFSDSDMKQLRDIIQEGILVNYKVKNNTAAYYIDKTVIHQISPLLTAFVKNMKDTDFNQMGELIKYIAADIPALLEDTVVLEIGLNVEK